MFIIFSLHARSLVTIRATVTGFQFLEGEFYLVSVPRSIIVVRARIRKLWLKKRKSDARLKQKAIIEFLTSEGATPVAIHRRLKQFFGADTYDISTVRAWARQAKLGTLQLDHRPHTGRPEMSNFAAVKARIEAKVEGDRSVTQRKLAEEFGGSLGIVNKIMKQLQWRRLCTKWVPKLLTNEMKRTRLEMSQQLLSRYFAEGESFISNIVTGDESWVHYYDPSSKEASCQYRHTSSPRVKKVRSERATGKLMLSVF